MIWSFSDYRTFKKCPRKWFYRSIYAESRAKNPERREAYLLSKLQSVQAWRGRIVDDVVGNLIVRGLNEGKPPGLNLAIEHARSLFEMQREFAMKHRVREPGMSPTGAGPRFAAFHKLEYGEAVADSELDGAWADVEQALRTLYEMKGLKDTIRNGSYRMAQRNLVFKHSGASVRAVPDLVVFFTNRPPLIVDWKVHTFGTHDYGDQLAVYSIALTRVKPHDDFPSAAKRWCETDIELIEAQLLRRWIRSHPLTEEDVQRTDDEIAQGIMQMRLACGGKDNDELTADDFPPAHNPETCGTCPFKRICWN